MPDDLTHQIHQYLTSAPGSLFAQQEVQMLDHWEGDANLLWRVRCGGEEAVVKVFLDAGQARSRRQFEGQRVFAPLGLAPMPLWADRYPHGLSRQLLVYRWSEGAPVDAHDRNEVEAWAAAIAALHTTATDEVQRFSPHPINLDYYWRIERGSIDQLQVWLADSGLMLSRWFAEIAAATANLVANHSALWVGTAPAPIHGDLSLAHSLVDRGSVLLLDWEMFGLGDPAQDVARLLQREEQALGAEMVGVWLASYLAHAPDPVLADRIATFRQLLDVHSVLYLLIGLQQHTGELLDPALTDALPYLQSALKAALDRAAATLALTVMFNAEHVAEELVAWLLAQQSRA